MLVQGNFCTLQNVRSTKDLSGHRTKPCIHPGDLLHDIGAKSITQNVTNNVISPRKDTVVACLYFYKICKTKYVRMVIAVKHKA